MCRCGKVKWLTLEFQEKQMRKMIYSELLLLFSEYLLLCCPSMEGVTVLGNLFLKIQINMSNSNFL